MRDALHVWSTRVEGAGGNRDFDGDFAPPRGSGVGLDQDDSATGTHTDEPGLTVPQGPASWLDTNLTNPEMINFFPNAGASRARLLWSYQTAACVQKQAPASNGSRNVTMN